MIPEFPGNSQRPNPKSEEVDRPVEEDRKLDKVVTGKVIRRKKPLGRRLMATFFSGDSGVLKHLFENVLIPALQNLATDMVTQGIERAVYGEVRSRRTSRGSSNLPRTNVSYDRPSGIVRSQYSAAPARRPISQPDAMDIGDIILDSHVNAEAVADSLLDILKEYGAVKVADLNMRLGETPSYTDQKFGWYDLQEMTIRRSRAGYHLILPDPEPLK